LGKVEFQKPEMPKDFGESLLQLKRGLQRFSSTKPKEPGKEKVNGAVEGGDGGLTPLARTGRRNFGGWAIRQNCRIS